MARTNATYTELDLDNALSGQVLTADGAGGAKFNDAPGGGGVPIGAIIAFGGTVAPSGFLFCDGAAISRTTYAKLFAEIGTAYGVGDGSTTFNLPDTRQKFLLGLAASGTGSTLGASGGSIDHTHSVPAHFHGKGTIAIGSSGTHTTAIDHDHGSVNTSTDGSHNHDISHNHAAFTSGSNSASHTHSIAHDHPASGSHGHNSKSWPSVNFQNLLSTGAGTQRWALGRQDGTLAIDADRVDVATSNSTVNLSNYTGNSGTQSANHTHSIDVPNYTGSSTFAGNHNHSVDLPNFVANSASTGAHTHGNSDFSGSVGNTGGVDGDASMTSGSENPPFVTANYIIRYERIDTGLSVEQLKSHTAFAGSGRFQLTDAIQTVNNTETTMTTIAVPDNSVMRFEIMVVCRLEDLFSNKSYWARITGAVRRNNGGSAVLVGTRALLEDDEGTPGYSADVDVSGNDLRIRVTGATSETVNWAATIEHQSVSLAV